MRWRLIIVSTENGDREDVVFLPAEDDTPASDFCAPDQSVDYDSIIEAELPDMFPEGYSLRRQW